MKQEKRGKLVRKTWQEACAHSLTPFKLIAFSLSFLLLFGCKNEISVNIKKPTKTTEAATNLNVTISNIQVINHQVVITGTNLNSVNDFQIKDGGAITPMQIESKTSTTLIANTFSNVTFAAGKILDFIFANANAAATFQVNFSLCDSALGGAGFNCSIVPNDKEVLSYDASTHKWRPRALNGLSYKGAWDALEYPELPVSIYPGDYYIVSVANPPYDVGDWIVFNGAAYDLIDNSQAIVSVAGKTGAVTLNLSDLTNIALTAPTTGQVLRFDGTNWVNNTFTVDPETDPTVKTFAQNNLPTCGTNQVLKSDGSTFSCVTDQTGAGAFTGTANRAVVTDGSGILTVSSITDTVLGYLSGVTGNIQTQLNSKQGTIGNGDITNAHLAGSIAQSKVTDLETDLAAKQDKADLDSDVREILLDGLLTVTNDVITAGDSILSAFGKLQKQITDLDSAVLKKTGGTLTVGTISGIPNPVTNDQVANKAYVDSATGSLNPQTPSAYSPSCPTGYISVPAIPYYPGPSFCVMKWEAKTVDALTGATTAAAGNPKASINRDNARTACRLIGPGYDLISNAQWQTIARNIADQAGNWSTGTAYSGELNRGHSDTSPNNSLAAVADDTDACNGTGQTCSNTVWDSQRRTHSLSNGEVIWDFAGNVWEWVTDNSVTAALGSNQHISTQRAGGRTQIQYGNDQFCATPDSSPYCGMGHGWFNYTAGAVLRGGYWFSDVNTGVFATRLNGAHSITFADIGFRCVFVP